ncbi:MAG: TlpA family protein disulfide reductase [Treponemataceae bacterium]
MKKGLLMLLILLISISSFAQTVGLKVGNIAPNFTLDTLEGKEVKLSDYRGRPVFLNFWATWCPPCVREMPDMQKIHTKYQDKLTMLGLNSGENKKEVQAFITKNKLSFPIILDPQGKISMQYNVQAIPTTYIIDKKGIIVEKKIGAMTEKQMEALVSKIIE